MTEHQHDREEDPARHPTDADTGDDWADEGGAVAEGPATHPADADPDTASESADSED
ncbi:hypothetical protein GCM10009623_20840 [Nocardioides aestuarii]|uniref:Uncharacterized protein n=1 Tax=Nocardioides aestuarii TaxID=252231 RepID=A0ABW4TLC0_9ACTN